MTSVDTAGINRADRFARSSVLTLLGLFLLSPIPILAAAPHLAPAWLLERTSGVPTLSIALLLLMAGLVGVSTLCLHGMDRREN
jgi:hypothetical protein